MLLSTDEQKQFEQILEALQLLLKGSNMLDLTEQNDGSAAITEAVNPSLNLAGRFSEQNRIAVLTETTLCTIPKFRMKKVLVIRQQLADRTYDLENRLDTALDRLLKTLNT